MPVTRVSVPKFDNDSGLGPTSVGVVTCRFRWRLTSFCDAGRKLPASGFRAPEFLVFKSAQLPVASETQPANTTKRRWCRPPVRIVATLAAVANIPVIWSQKWTKWS